MARTKHETQTQKVQEMRASMPVVGCHGSGPEPLYNSLADFDTLLASRRDRLRNQTEDAGP